MDTRRLFAIAGIFALCAAAFAQAPSAAAKLYQEAKNYADKRFAEFQRQKLPFDEKLYEQTRAEQRARALKNAAKLAAQSNLNGDDWYYLGELYRLGEQFNEARTAYQKFLAGNPPRAHLFTSTARALLVALHLRFKDYEAAENMLAEYAREHPNAPRADLNLLLAKHFYDDGNFEKAVTNARAAGVAAETEAGRGVDGATDTIYEAGFMLSQTQAALKQPNAAVATLQNLRQRAFDQYQALNYAEATERLADLLLDLGRKPDALKYLDESVAAAPKRFTAPNVQSFVVKQLRRKQFAVRLQGEPAPELEIADWIEQEPVKLADLHGRVVLLDFWATWCGPCIAAFPHLSEWHKKYAAQGLTIIGVTHLYGEGDGQDLTPEAELVFIRNFKQRHRLPYGVAVTEGEKTHRAYYVTGLPTAILLDRAGRIRFTQTGTGPAAKKELEAQIEKLLAEKQLDATGRLD
jgi:thiol-disulfide isomerase/thioredoxin